MSKRSGVACLAVALVGVRLGRPPPRAQNAERVEAVEWAREGELDRAITRLQALGLAYPGDVPIASDLTVILGWAGRDREMLEVFETIGPDAAFDYTLFAAARSARAVGELDRAEAYLTRGAERFPDEPRWALLRALVYVDGGRFEEARQVLTASYGTDPSDLEGLLVWGYLSAQARDLPAALRYYTEVLKLQPENREALAGRVMALEALGAPFRAQELARAPARLLNQSEQDRIAETQGAMMLRWGRVPVVDPARRFDATDRGIAAMERRVAELEARPDWGERRPPAGPVRSPRRLSRPVPDAGRGGRVRAPASGGRHVPAYARLSAASAYLYLEDPASARDLYQSVVDEDPKERETRLEAHLGLFYAWVELERYDRAYAVIDTLEREQPPFRAVTSTRRRPSRTSQGRRRRGGRARPLLRRPAGRGLGPAVAAGGGGAGGELAPGGPRQRGPSAGLAAPVADLIEPWLQSAPNDVDLQLGQAGTLLALRRYPEAGAAIDRLYAAFPESKSVQDLKKDWDVHRMWEWVTRVEPSYGAEPTAPGVGIAVTTRLWSPPLWDYWHATGAYRYVTEDLPEGRETWHRAAAGLEYRGPSLRAFAELTYNESTEDGLGGRAEIEWTPTDQVSLSATGEIFSRDTPIRALKNG